MWTPPGLGPRPWTPHVAIFLLLGSCEASPAARALRSVTLSAPEQGLSAQLNAGGAQLTQGGSRVVVSTLAWGREGSLRERGAVPLHQTPCVPLDGPCKAGAELRGAGLTEWWTHTPQGLEQGWTVEQRPGGEGPLFLELEVLGAQVSMRPQGLLLRDEAGGKIRVSELLAWDADGVPLAAVFEPREHGFAVLVDDQGARYPLTIDPLYSDEATAFKGEAEGDYFGVSVAQAGDINQDGYADLLVGASGHEGSTGRVYLYLGSASGLSSAATLDGEALEDNFGFSVAGVGDLNQDGYEDAAVGAHGNNGGTGRVYVYYGSASGLSAAPGATLPGEKANSQFGRAVAAAGDVNGDGFPDLLVGAKGYSSSTGRAYVYYGSASGVSGSNRATLAPELSGGSFGIAVAGAGDLNQDGYADLVIGAKGHENDTGAAYVYYGSPTGPSVSADALLTGENVGDVFGSAVAGVGDLNSDGFADLAVGAYQHNSSTGRAYVYYGSAEGISSSAALTLNGQTSGDNFGWSLSGAGDIDADGDDELLVGAPSMNSKAGGVYVFDGSSDGPSSTPSSNPTGSKNGAWFGRAVAGLGDVDGDGYGDIAEGAPYHSSSLGQVEVLRGYVDADGDGFASTTDCDDNNSAVYPGGIDVGGDGLDQNCDGADEDAEARPDPEDSGLDEVHDTADEQPNGGKDPVSEGRCSSAPGLASLWPLALLLLRRAGQVGRGAQRLGPNQRCVGESPGR